MGAAYSFASRWHVDAPRERCWAVLERMLRPGDTWWPSVRLVEAPLGFAVGETLLLDVRSPFGYRLRPRLAIDDVDPGRAVTVRSTGDLAGTGRLQLVAAGESTDIEILWQVTTERRWMNATAFALRPLFSWAHARVMAEGERSLRAAVAGDAPHRSDPRNAGNPGDRGVRHPSAD